MEQQDQKDFGMKESDGSIVVVCVVTSLLVGSAIAFWKLFDKKRQ